MRAEAYPVGIRAGEITVVSLHFNTLVSRCSSVSPSFLERWKTLREYVEPSLVQALEAAAENSDMKATQLIVLWADQEVRQRQNSQPNNSRYSRMPTHVFLSDTLLCLARQKDHKGEPIGTKEKAAKFLVEQALASFDTKHPPLPDNSSDNQQPLRDRTVSNYDLLLDEEIFRN